MSREVKTFREAVTLMSRACREASPLFLSIELWLMVLVAGAMVGGFWLAVLGDARSLLAFGFAVVYIATRAALHVKRIVTWPFI
jgi:hypothetical protein